MCVKISHLITFLCCGATAQARPKLPLFDVYRSHTIRRTHLVGLLWTSYQPIAEAATYTTHNKNKSWTSMFSVWFKPEIPATKQLETYALGSMASWISTF